jgi:DNA-binding MarR family transcriptional regulator
LGNLLANVGNKDGLTPSICEEALNRFGESDDSLAGMVAHHSIGFRDFMLLSLVCDQEAFDVDQLARALGLSRERTGKSIDRLTDAGLVKHNGAATMMEDSAEVRATVSGRVLARRILDQIG